MSLSPDIVIEQLKKIGVTISRPTLTRYENQGLIPKARRGGGGRGAGRWTAYPDGTVEEAFASWSLMHGEYGEQGEKDIFGGRLPIISPDATSHLRWRIMYELHRGVYLQLNGHHLIIEIFQAYSFGRELELEEPNDFHWETTFMNLEIWLKRKWSDEYVYAHYQLKKALGK